MTDRIDRFKARRQLQAQLRDQPVLVALPTPADALAMLQQPIDTQRVDLAFSALSVDLDTKVSDAQVDAALQDFTKAFNGERFDQLMRDSRREVLQAVVVPFGLGKVLSAYDKVGGNVDTIHNARKEVYATDEARDKYAKVPPMDKALRKTFDDKIMQVNEAHPVDSIGWKEAMETIRKERIAAYDTAGKIVESTLKATTSGGSTQTETLLNTLRESNNRQAVFEGFAEEFVSDAQKQYFKNIEGMMANEIDKINRSNLDLDAKALA